MNTIALKRKAERLIDELPPELLPEAVDFLGTLRKRGATSMPKSENTTEELMALTAQADPVLAGLWDNEKDAAYDRL
jgi:hypothetical protein